MILARTAILTAQACKGRVVADALRSRAERMVAKPVAWSSGHPGLADIGLEPLHRPRALDKALAMEAALIAQAWMKRPRLVRGGPWCRRKLPEEDVREMTEVDAALACSMSLSSQAEAVWDVANRMPSRGIHKKPEHLQHQHIQITKISGNLRMGLLVF